MRICKFGYLIASYPSCCSGRVLTGLFGTPSETHSRNKEPLLIAPHSPNTSILPRLHNGDAILALKPILALEHASISEEFLYLLVAEQLNTYLSYNTSFVVMADNFLSRGSIRCSDFGKWAEDNPKFFQEVQKSRPSIGNHNRPCSNWTFTGSQTALDTVRAELKDMFLQANKVIDERNKAIQALKESLPAKKTQISLREEIQKQYAARAAKYYRW